MARRSTRRRRTTGKIPRGSCRCKKGLRLCKQQNGRVKIKGRC